MGEANSERAFDPAADIAGVPEAARAEVVALLKRIEESARAALAKSVAARQQAPVVPGTPVASKPVTAESKALAAALAKLTGELTAALELLVKEHAACFFGRACFAAGTPGGHAAIETIAVGDLVLSRDEHDAAGPVGAKVVEEVFRRLGALLEVRAGGRVIETTGEHPFHVAAKGWTPARELRVGDRLSCEDGSSVVVEGVRDTGRWAAVYNLRVADHHTYFVGTTEWGFSVWAHNADCDIQREAKQLAQSEEDANPRLSRSTRVAVAELGNVRAQGVSASVVNDPYNVHPALAAGLARAVAANPPGYNHGPGDCAEVRAVNALLWKIDPGGTLSVIPTGISVGVYKIFSGTPPPLSLFSTHRACTANWFSPLTRFGSSSN